MQNHARPDQLSEAGLFYLDPIGAGSEIRQVVLARCIASYVVAEIRGNVDGCDLCAGDSRFGGIGYATGERDTRGLGAKNEWKEKKKEEGGDSAHDTGLSGVVLMILQSVGDFVKEAQKTRTSLQPYPFEAGIRLLIVGKRMKRVR